MKSRYLLPAIVTAAVALALPETAGAQQIGTQRRFGLGLVLGYPDVGLSINYFMNPGMSLQIDPIIRARSGSLLLGGRVDVLFWPRPLARLDFADIRWFIGPGLWFAVVNDGYYRYNGVYYAGGGFSLAAELAVGIGFQFRGVPIDLNLEIVPRLWLLDPAGFGIFFDWGAALNARFYF